MKKNKIVNLIMIAMIGLMASCSKEKIQNNEPLNQTKPKIGAFSSDVTTIAVGPENQANQYDFVGILHNEGLNYLIAHAQNYYINNELHRDSFKFYSDLYYTSMASRFIDSVYIQNNHTDSVKVFLDRFNEVYFYNILAHLTTELSDSQKSYFNQILVQIDSFDNFVAFKSSLIQIENNILASSLPENDKMILLMGASVSRYSAYYWSTVSIESIRDYFNDNNFPPTSAIGNILKWDFQGAVAGGIAGLYAGLSSGAYVFGPGGVVLTAAGGATVGAIRGSFIDLLWELFWAGMNWFQN